MASSSKKGLWHIIAEAYIRFSFRYPWIPILFLICLTWFFTHLATGLRIDTDLRVLLPDGTASKMALQQAEKRMGSTDLFTIAFEAPSADAVGKIQKDLADSLKKWPDVVWAQYDQDRSFFEKQALLYMPVEELEDLKSRLSGMIGGKFTKANPLLMDLGEEDAEKPSLEGWPNAQSLRRQGLPKDIVDGLLAKIQAEKNPSDSGMQAKTETPGPAKPDSLKGRLMGWHEEKKVWVGVVLAQLKKPSTDAIYAQSIYHKGENLIASMKPASYQAGMVAKVAGAYRNFSEINQVQGDIVVASSISFFLMVALLWFFVRRPLNLMLIILPLFVAMSWASGMTFLVYHRLTMLTAFILALILGLGIEYTVHLYSRWAEESRKGKNGLEAMVEALTATGRALISGAATNIFAMLSLQFGHFKGFNEYGIVVSIGIVLCLLSTWLVIPPVFFLFIRIGEWLGIKAKPIPGLKKVVDWLLPQGTNVGGGILLPRIPFDGNFRKWVFGIGILVTLIIAFGPKVGFENDFKNLRGKSTSAGISYGRAVGAGRNTSPSVILGKDEAQMRSVHDSLVQRFGQPADSMMESFATIQSFVPSTQEQQKRLAVLIEINELLTARALDNVDSTSKKGIDLLRKYAHPDSFGFAQLPDWSQRFLSEADGTHGRLGYLYGSLRESDAVESAKFQSRFGSLPSSTGPVMVASSGFIYADVVSMVKKDGYYLGGVTLLFLIIITWLDMRSWRGVTITVGFISLSAFWTYKIMGIMGLKLGMYNLVVVPTILSVSVDSVIHLYHRRMELGAGKLTELIHTTGSAVLTGTLNNAFGFVGLCFVSHKGMQTIGLLATLGIGSGLVIMFTILPFCLEWLCPKQAIAEEH